MLHWGLNLELHTWCPSVLGCVYRLLCMSSFETESHCIAQANKTGLQLFHNAPQQLFLIQVCLCITVFGGL